MKENQDFKRLKKYMINHSIRMTRRQEEFFKQFRLERSLEDFLTVKEVTEQYGYSGLATKKWTIS